MRVDDRGGMGDRDSGPNGGGSSAGGSSTSTGGRTSTGGSSSGGQVSAIDAGVDAYVGETGAGGAASEARVCTRFDASAPFLPKRCTMTQNRGCTAGATCISLEQLYCAHSPCVGVSQQDDLCLPTGVTTSCASGCLEAFTCACLAADFRFDRTGLSGWTCCDTPRGPSFVLPPLTCTGA